MPGIVEAFSSSYAEARKKFLEAAAAAGLPIESHAHPLKGRDGEDLAMDVVRDGPADAKKLLIVSSACHGVEGYCGSGVQVFALHDQEWRDKAHAAGLPRCTSTRSTRTAFRTSAVSPPRTWTLTATSRTSASPCR